MKGSKRGRWAMSKEEKKKQEEEEEKGQDRPVSKDRQAVCVEPKVEVGTCKVMRVLKALLQLKC
jgi:hypothetical protein